MSRAEAVDWDITLYAPALSDRSRRFLAAERTLYGSAPPTADVMTDGDRWAYWLDEWHRRTERDRDCFVMVTGPPGCGKSTLVQRLCADYDPTYAPHLKDRVAFRPSTIGLIYKTCGRGNAASTDEAMAAGLMSTDTQSPIQKRLVELFGLIRYRNVLFFVVTPETAELAKAARARRANFWIECEDEPNIGTAWVKVPLPPGTRRRRSDPDAPPFRLADVNPLRWDTLEGTPLWDAYLPLMRTAKDTRADEITKELIALEKEERHGRRKR